MVKISKCWFIKEKKTLSVTPLHVTTTSKENVKSKVVTSSNIYAYMMANNIQYI